MPARALQRPCTNEATRIFDSLDRWTLAERFGIDRIHDLTRVQVYGAVAVGRSCGHFQDVVGELAAADGSPSSDGMIVVNWADFTNDLPEGKHVEYGSLRPLAEAHRWLRETIANHCPFVQPALNHRRIWMTVARQRETHGQRLLGVLRQAMDAFRQLSPPDDRNRMLNALMVLVPEVSPPGYASVADFLGGFRQDFNADEMPDDLILGSFVPSQPTNAIYDPKREAPPAYVFRHKVQGQRPHHRAPVHLSELVERGGE